MQYYLNPPEVRCKESIKKGCLRLAPITYMGKIHNLKKTCSTSKTHVSHKGQQWCLDPPLRISKEDQSEWDRNSLSAAYWWVKSTADAKKANMNIVETIVGGVYIPVLHQAVESTRPVDVSRRSSGRTGIRCQAPEERLSRPEGDIQRLLAPHTPSM